MKFGKLTDISSIDFRLPKDPMATSSYLEQLTKKDKKSPDAYIGATGWSMKEWIGKIYPKGTKAKDFLKIYAKHFNTIELNTTHYRTPSPSTIEKWKSESSEDFKFCPKILQAISHRNDFGIGTGQLIEFCESIQGLEEKLGCSFIQLPPYFGSDRIKILEHFINTFPDHIPLAVELRHESWFQNQHHFDAVANLFQQKGISMVITDVAGRRDVLHLRLTSPTAMIRFVGNGLVQSDYDRIDDWIQRLKDWFEKGLETVYFFTHEPDNILSPELATYLVENLEKLGNVRVRGPKLIDPDEGKQISLFG